MIGTCLGGLTVHKPKTLADAFAILNEHGEDAAILAGGTDLLVDLRVQRRDEHHLVSLANIAELRGITKTGGGVTIGAATTLTDLLSSDVIRDNYPALIEATEVMGSNQIRNSGTIGGNIASAVPSADLPPVLLVLGAEVVIANQSGERTIPMSDFFQGVRKTCVATGEIVTSIIIPNNRGNAVYERFDLRQGNSLAVAAVAANITMDGNTIADAQVALGAVSPTPEIVEGVNDILIGNFLNDDLLEEVSELAIAASNPITDLRGSAEYRRELVGILTKRAIKRAIGVAQ
jgi:aerobic carbon-monoxide dehydrogenase medium subunit